MSEILREFKALSQPSLDTLTLAFGKLGKLYRIGGPERVYEIEGRNQQGVIFSINDSLMAIALGWSSSPKHIDTVYWWSDFSFDRSPEYAIDIPDQGDVGQMVPQILKMIRNKTLGEVEL